ncbi:MAG: alanine racemase, partial [Clostridia bacterium]|nr:alanine racemase [Clostridia bacterium]
VKADAYGHGAVPVAKTLCEVGVDWLGVSNLEEAIQLRLAGIDRPMLVISYTPPCEAARLASYDITQTVVSADHARELSQAAVAAGVELAVHIKLDTGMSRVGFVCHEEQEVPAVVRAVGEACRLPGLRAQGIFTHFASADEQSDDGFTRGQFALFTAVTEGLAAEGITFELRHCCNSAATLRFPEMHLDMVRPGVILYGLQPDGWMESLHGGFMPVMEMKTTVSMVKDLPADTPVSYNRTYRTGAPARVAAVPIGYADGYSRRLSNRAYMLVGGKPAPVIGRVCMDQTVLDVTALPQVAEGTVVTVFGRDGDALLSVDTLAAWMDTIHYEVVCLISKRVPRMYFENGRSVEQLNYLLP